MDISSDSVRSIEKLNADNFHVWKFKMQMVLEQKDLWKIVSGEEKRPEKGGDKVGAAASLEAKAYDKRAKEAFVLICLSVGDSQLAIVRSAKSAQEAWLQHYERRGWLTGCSCRENSSPCRCRMVKLFLRRKFFTLQMQEAIGAPVSEEDIVMTLLCSLPESFHSMIVALESRTDELDLEFVVASLMHEQTRRSEVAAGAHALEPAFYSKQKSGQPAHAPSSINSAKPAKPGNCIFCGKPGH